MSEHMRHRHKPLYIHTEVEWSTKEDTVYLFDKRWSIPFKMFRLKDKPSHQIVVKGQFHVVGKGNPKHN
jgi:hypothetical protein